MSRELAAWIAQGERGAAADTLLEHLTQIPLCTADSFGSYPQTPTELRHCFLLIEAVPSLRTRLSEVAALGPEWATVVQHWRELEDVFTQDGASITDREDFAPRTYRRLRELLDHVTDQRKAVGT